MSTITLSAHLGLLFTELPLAERFRAAADAGFAAVDLPDLVEAPIAEIEQRLAEAGLHFNQTTTPFAAPQHGLAALPERVLEFRAHCEALVRVAETIRPNWVHVMSGLPEPDSTFAETYETYLENLAFAADLFEKSGVGALIEPINATDLPGYFMKSNDLARQAVSDVGHPNLRIMFDVYHYAMDGIDPVAAFRETAAQVGHVQFADCPGRHQPGTGTIDFEGFYRLLVEVGYDGYVSGEYVPKGSSTPDTLGWMADVP